MKVISITPEDLTRFPTKDLTMLRMEATHVLRGRRKEALRKFREANPVLGMTLAIGEDKDHFVGFAELGQAFPKWVLVHAEYADEVETTKVYSPALRDALIKGADDRAQVIFNPAVNTATGEEWIDEDLNIDV